MNTHRRPAIVLLAFAALLAIGARPIYDAVLQSDMDGGGFNINNLAGITATTGNFPLAQAGTVTAARVGAPTIEATNLTAASANATAATVATLNAQTANLARAEAGTLHATNLTADAATIAALTAGTATVTRIQAPTIETTNITAASVAANTATIGTLTNGTGIFQRAEGNFVGNAIALTNIHPRHWAVIEIRAFQSVTNWTDATVKISTNNFYPANWDSGSADLGIVFRYTTSEPAPNETPSWEQFEGPWLPRVFWAHSHKIEDGLYGAILFSHKTNSTHSIAERMAADANSGPIHYWKFCIAQTNAWFHPTNNLTAAYLMQSATASETNAWGKDVWRPVEIFWTDHDPRPRRFIEVELNQGYNSSIEYQHQTP